MKVTQYCCVDRHVYAVRNKYTQTCTRDILQRNVLKDDKYTCINYTYIYIPNLTWLPNKFIRKPTYNDLMSRRTRAYR
jgi:hypothetical protein